MPVKPLSLNQPINSCCCPLQSVYKNSVIPLLGLRAWSVNSSGPAGVINLSPPTLQVWCLVSRGPVSATFLEAPARCQPRQPLEPPDWWLGRAGVKEPWDKRGGTPPDDILGSLSDQCSYSLDGQVPTELIGGTDQLTRNSHRIRWGSRAGPRAGREASWMITFLELLGREQQLRKPLDSGGREASSWLINSLGLPGREQQLRKPGDSEGRHCDSLWMIVSAWLLIERVREIFLFGNCKINSFCTCN